MRNLLRFWFTSDERVDRRTYFTHGLALALVKYAVDAALIWVFWSVLWTPLDYVTAGLSLERSNLAQAPTFLKIVLALWTAPFFWIGMTLSARRAMDAGVTPWLSQLFFVPFLNYLFIAAMSLAPSSATAQTRPAPAVPGPEAGKLGRALRAIGLGAAAGIALVGLGLLTLSMYGASLFFGAPFAIGAVAAYAYNRSHAASGGETARVVLLTVLATGLATIAFAMEGAICVAMAFPFAALIALMGSSLGRFIALTRLGTPNQAFIAVLLVPLTAPLVDAPKPLVLHEVRSAIEIDAPPLAVWRNVVAFPTLAAPTELIFKTGIAYPTGARIEGEGVGAMRYCEFSTGAFVEPITHWEPGTRLTFDVIKSPPAMRELSPYDIHPPHLDGYFAGRRGEFRLVALPGGRTRLEGSTWYELQIGPEAYWAPLADALVGRIHQRVLRHIKATTERQSPSA